MNRIDRLIENYKTHIQMPLRTGLPASQRVWFAVYPAEDERHLTIRIDEFELLTLQAGHRWSRVDLAGQLTRWLASVDDDDRADWFTHPSDVTLYARTEWKDLLAGFFKEAVASVSDPEHTVFALTGLMELYDLLHVSDLIDTFETTFPGYLLVFFPGARDGNTYRFLDARAGWNYLAVPILADK